MQSFLVWGGLKEQSCESQGTVLAHVMLRTPGGLAPPRVQCAGWVRCLFYTAELVLRKKKKPRGGTQAWARPQKENLSLGIQAIKCSTFRAFNAVN